MEFYLNIQSYNGPKLSHRISDNSYIRWWWTKSNIEFPCQKYMHIICKVSGQRLNVKICSLKKAWKSKHFEPINTTL